MSTHTRPNARGFGHVLNSQADTFSSAGMPKDWKEGLVTRRDGWCVMQVGVEAAVTNQLWMGALFLDHASIHYDNTVNPAKRGDPVRDKDHCLVSKMLRQICKNPSF